ncbi:MAG: DUF3459 domain-containing protein, partial [Chitinispirillaceae bacterium]|nr:DUF3459 domain-containing protein [Chitinispirillaceae bacterium]
CSQNHDQVGNRMLGDRLAALVNTATLKCAAALVLLSPRIPLLFMGEEWGERSPFLYFVSHGDPDLVAAVRKGRKEEFSGFIDGGEPPDPQDEATFLRSKLTWERRTTEQQALLGWYRRLIEVRNTVGGACDGAGDFDVSLDSASGILRLYRRTGGRRMFAFINLSTAAATSLVGDDTGKWLKILDSADPAWGGNGEGSPEHFSTPAPIRLPGRGVAVYAQSAPATNDKKAAEMVEEIKKTVAKEAAL